MKMADPIPAPDPDFDAWWFNNVIPMINRRMKDIAAVGYAAGKKKGKDTAPPPPLANDFVTGQSALGVPRRDEET